MSFKCPRINWHTNHITILNQYTLFIFSVKCLCRRATTNNHNHIIHPSNKIMSLSYRNTIVAQCWRQILHGQRVLSVFVHLWILAGSMTRTRCIARTCFAVLQSIVGHIRNEFLGGNRYQTDSVDRCTVWYSDQTDHRFGKYCIEIGQKRTTTKKTYILGSDASNPDEFK